MFRRIRREIKTIISTPPFSTWKKWLEKQGVEVRGNVYVYGRPRVILRGNAVMIIEGGVTMDSDPLHNMTGIIHPCSIEIEGKGKLYVGKDTGMSGVLIRCQESVHIGAHVGLGANVSIFDTDSHPINPYERIVLSDDEKAKTSPVQIDDYAWIGANAMILKGVHIGKGAVIGAGSVVTSDVPELTIFAGNPARYIKDVDITDEQRKQIFK